MILYDLIRSVSRDDVFHELFSLYPDQYSNLQGYESMWYELLETEVVPNESTMQIHIDLNLPDEDDETEWVQVHGKQVVLETKQEVNGSWYKHDDKDEPYEGYYALEYTPWGNWLSFEVVSNLVDASPAVQLAHIIWEMSWAGYTNKDIQARADEIFDAAADIMSEIDWGKAEGDEAW